MAHETARMKELEGARLASFRARAIALALDGILVLSLLAICVLILVWSITKRHVNHSVSFNFSNTSTGFQLNVDGKPIEWFSYVMEFGIPIFYWGLFTYLWNGRTPGKWIAGIRVVSTCHEKIHLWQSIERALGYAVSALELGLGFFQYFISPNRRATHDRLAETIVICDPSRPLLDRGKEIWKSKLDTAKRDIKKRTPRFFHTNQ